MTVEQYGAGGLPAGMTDDDFMEGLEDLLPEDMGASPRMTVEHHDGVFKVSSTGEEFTTANFIILGLVRQRTMWHPDIPDGESPAPMCKSPDFENGFPEMSEEVKVDFRFPWTASGMEPNMLVDNGPGVKKSVSCSDCKLKEWGTDPKSDRPWCSEEFTLPLLYQSEDGTWSPALLTLKRSALKTVKTYMASFKSSRTPMFAFITKATLSKNKRGNVRYCTPEFSKGEATDRGEWQGYFDSFKGVRDYLKAFPQDRADESSGSDQAGGLAGAENDVDPWSDEGAQAAAKAAPKKTPPAPATPKAEPKAAPVEEVIEAEAVDDDDEPPF